MALLLLHVAYEVKKIVAIPKYEDGVAPCFEAANRILISELDAGRITSSKLLEASGCEGIGRVRLLRKEKVSLMVCDGIKGCYRDMLSASGILVIAGVTLPVGEILKRIISGTLEAEPGDDVPEEQTPQIPLEDLVCWARELFESRGYRTIPGAKRAPFPIDLVAEISCPLCGKPVRVAICCGAHAYRVDQELREFQRASSTDYHAQVYVRPASNAVARCCRDYGIQLMDPAADVVPPQPGLGSRIPLLHGPVVGHEKAGATPAQRRPKPRR